MVKIEYLKTLTAARRKALLTRSAVDLSSAAERTREIFSALLADPAKELFREYGPLKAELSLKDFLVSLAELEQAEAAVSQSLIGALNEAKENIKKFHLSQLERSMWLTEVAPGLLAGRVTSPLERVGVYIPGGRASYPSSALMNIIPAVCAGVREIIAVTPPGPQMTIRPEILTACRLSGATKIYKLGGAWAVGCLAYGLAGLPKVDKIVGPGSTWVMAAKMAVYGQVDIDSPAGPSEGFIIADSSSEPAHLAWDFLAQLEHDPEASAILITDSEQTAASVVNLVNQGSRKIDRAAIVGQSLKNAAILVVDDLAEAFDFANEYAPEHLEIVTSDPWSSLGRVKHAGSVFLGPNAPIAAGDYATGPNHVLPTGGSARAFSGLSVDAFLKKTTFQYLSPKALADVSGTVITLAESEGLTAHAESVRVRVGAQTKAAPTGQNVKK
ncbi:MAG: histidinol dehydrogenase [Deltaproteobacteria bacterium]|jgi:histidinol dehydrogenase|nr:histidinol dehydrogenase [Deltaproteobacteria bacterium]